MNAQIANTEPRRKQRNPQLDLKSYMYHPKRTFVASHPLHTISQGKDGLPEGASFRQVGDILEFGEDLRLRKVQFQDARSTVSRVW